MRLFALLLAGTALSAFITPRSTSASLADTVTALANAFSAAVLIPPTAPSALASGGTVRLSWTATTSSWASGHDVMRATSLGGPFTQVAQLSPRTTGAYVDIANIPGVKYYYKIHSYAGAWLSTDTTAVSATVTSTIRVGSNAVQASLNSAPAGTAEAFLYTASTSGSVGHLTVYLDAANSATRVLLALYTSTGTDPGTLLTQGTLSAPASGGWNTVSVSAVTVSSGTKYWIAALVPVGTGALDLRSKSSGGSSSELSAQTNMASLPPTWSSGSTSAASPASVYASP